MSVKNRELDRVRSNLTVKELREAIDALHLQEIPEHQRKRAMAYMLGRLMRLTVTDPAEREKEAFKQLVDTHYRHHLIGE